MAKAQYTIHIIAWVEADRRDEVASIVNDWLVTLVDTKRLPDAVTDLCVDSYTVRPAPRPPD